MIKHILLAILMIYSYQLIAQKVGVNTTDPQEALDVNGKIRVGNDNNNAQSPAGTIRFNPETGDFEGFDGQDWRSFTPDPTDFFWPQPGQTGSPVAYWPYSPSDAVQGDGFGSAVDVFGNIAIIGSPNYGGNKGRVHILRRYPNNIWILEKVLTSPTPQVDEFFGCSVAISGNRIVIGAKGHISAGQPRGAFNVYEYIAGNWNLVMTEIGSNLCTAQLGYDVDIENNIIIASAPLPTGTCLLNPNDGIVYIYELLGGSTNVGSISPPKPLTFAGNNFGHSISISQGWIAISAPFSTSTINVDSVYMYKNSTSPTNYTFRQSSSGLDFDDLYGYAVSIHGNIMLIGEPLADHSTATDDRGSSHVWEYNPSLDLWVRNSESSGDSVSNFGYSVSVSNKFLISGAYRNVTNPWNTVQVLRKNIAGSYFEVVCNIEDPGASQPSEFLGELSTHNDTFVIGYPSGLSANGQAGGRVILGKVR